MAHLWAACASISPPSLPGRPLRRCRDPGPRRSSAASPAALGARGPAAFGPVPLGPAALGPAALSPAALGPAPLSHAPLGPAVPRSRFPQPRSPQPRSPQPRSPRPRCPSVPLPSVPLPSPPFPSAPLPSAPFPSAPLPSPPFPSPALPSARSAQGVRARPAGAALPGSIAGTAPSARCSCLRSEPELPAIVAGAAICQPHRRGNTRGALPKEPQPGSLVSRRFPSGAQAAARAGAPSGLRAGQGCRPQNSFVIAPRRFTPATLNGSPTLKQPRGSGC
ncbi:uncharacterized protein LOC134418931 [Melospiza melodia melodia]|uniref:uncharacterized protein LOC134418931 n=1 Tax=Melospiza melodia melodia TaxID=1914991 RepID=UPI002FD3743F